MDFTQSLELSLVKAHKIILSKVFPIIYTTCFMKYRDRNERKSKKQNPNIWLLKNFLACLLGEEKYLLIPN